MGYIEIPSRSINDLNSSADINQLMLNDKELKSQTDLIVNKLDKNTLITPATKTKITYDYKGLVTSGADATTADIADSTNKRYCTDAQKTVIGNTSGTNTGDEITESGSNSNGSYIKFKDGTMIQWGAGYSAGVNPRGVALPTAFYNTAYNVTATMMVASTTPLRIVSMISYGTTNPQTTIGFYVRANYSDGGDLAGEPLFWQAIGRWKA